MSKYQIIKGTTIGEPYKVVESFGYNWETGEEEFEEYYETKFDPHEEVISEFASYNEARKEYLRITEEFEDDHQWPWNNPDIEFYNDGECRTEYTNNEDSIWFILKKSKEETEEEEIEITSETKDFEKMYLEMHDRYNPYPYQESRATIFGKALTAGEIDEEIFNQAHKYFGTLWRYCGD